MGISDVKPMGSISSQQMADSQSVDFVSKGIQNEIDGMQRKIQQLSSDEEISVDEKMKARQELRREISRLNVKLRQRQAEVKREQRKETLAKETQGSEEQEENKQQGRVQIDEGDKKDLENQDFGLSRKGMKAIVAADSSMEQAISQGMVVSRIEGGIVILKGEIRQNKARNTDVENKQEELEKQEEKAKKASDYQGSALGEAHKAIKDVAVEETDGIEKTTGLKKQENQETGIFDTTNFSKNKDQNVQKKIFFTSVDIRG